MMNSDSRSLRIAMEMLVIAMDKARSTDPRKVAPELEQVRFTDNTGEVSFRTDNHQLLQPLFISTLVKAGGKDVRLDVERTGLGFRTDTRIEAAGTSMSTTCKFKRRR